MVTYKDFEVSRVGSNNISRDILPYIDNNGDFKEVTGKDAIITSIRNLLMTPLGIYPFDPTYGSELYKMLFEMNDEETIDNIKFEVKDRIEQYEDRVRVLNVNIRKGIKNVAVDVDIRIRGEQDKTKLSVFMKKLGDSILSDDDTLTSSIWGLQ